MRIFVFAENAEFVWKKYLDNSFVMNIESTRGLFKYEKMIVKLPFKEVCCVHWKGLFC